MTTVGWLELLPPLPLAAGVPVVRVGGERHLVLSLGHETAEGLPAASVWDGATLTEVFFPLDALRVDLEDSLGFVHALRQLVDSCREHRIPLIHVLAKPCLMEVLAPWVKGETTHAHRMALAAAHRRARALAAQRLSGVPS